MMKKTQMNVWPTCSDYSWYILGSNKQVIDGVHQMFDVDSPHVVVISISRTSSALYRHKVVIPKTNSLGAHSIHTLEAERLNALNNADYTSYV